ncbi:CBS domain-containing protein [Singulisphaera sp. GP187]|uniref:CBS domain-containing protein n=1 Tax=Singulisphaera sp. GP187 TaxID=1882752 RepID=UPI00092944A6|nr:CBS domain-containing protein [Singulisphaera sp. GP187]SIO66755.1 CBS domain-containing protein [Singulisphaera sp. GP187]
MAEPSRSKLTAADVMTPAPRTCSIFSTVLEAVLLFRDADCGAVPVIEDGKPVGILTDRDVALALAEHEENLPDLPVGKIMTQGVFTVAPELDIDTLVGQFGDRRVRRLLVVGADERLLGIVSWADVAPYVPDREVGEAVTEVVEKP